jgi:putative membrane protein insertion efficiency factor
VQCVGEQSLAEQSLAKQSLAKQSLAKQGIFWRRSFVRIIGLYQLIISPLLPSACRFYPTCSQYMRDAVERYGVVKGVWMGVRRLMRCHPFHAGGFDPVR